MALTHQRVNHFEVNSYSPYMEYGDEYYWWTSHLFWRKFLFSLYGMWRWVLLVDESIILEEILILPIRNVEMGTTGGRVDRFGGNSYSPYMECGDGYYWCMIQ